MSVKFLKNYRIYFEGETATFKEDEERELIARGTAVRVVPDPKRPEHRQTVINSRT